MCSPKTITSSNGIGLYWSDEELIMLLVRMAKGPPFPNDVIEDVNPYQYKPSNLPQEFWFYIRSDEKKDSEHGFWKTKGEPSEIYSNSSITGLRTTLEFYEGRGPHSQRTNWAMQEYSVTRKVLHSSNNLKGSNLLCRVFLTSGNIENKNLEQKMDCAESVGAKISSQARSRSDNIVPLRTSEGAEDLFETDWFTRGDYLELNDLVDPGSRSFSSDDSSCVTLSSNECFDSLALLKDLEDEINKDEESKRANYKYSVAASAKPDEVVVPAPTLGSLVGSGNESHSPNEKSVHVRRDAENAFEKQKNVKNGDRKRSTSNSDDDMSSSSSNKSVPQGEKKHSARKLKKLNRKYLCFMPF